MMLDTGFCSVWPIQHHLRFFFISISMGVCFALFHSSSFETTSGHLMLRMFDSRASVGDRLLFLSTGLGYASCF